MRTDLTHSSTSAVLLLDFAASHGVSAETVLRGCSHTRAELDSARATITGAEELQLIANAVAAMGNRPGLGLALGTRYHLAAYGIWGFALMSAPTLRIAFETGLRYLDLTYSYLEIELVSVGDEVWLTLDASAVPSDLQQFMVERDIAAIATIQRELFVKHMLPLRIELALPEPADVTIYQRTLSITPHFGAAQHRVVLNAAALDLPLPQANPEAMQRAEQQCRQLLTRARMRTGVAGQVRDALLSQIGGRLPDIEDVAEKLHLTSRTLRRRLDAEGTSYRALLDELRQTLAEELLGTAGMKVAEVAARLGYSESASFLHARKRWRTAAAAIATTP